MEETLSFLEALVLGFLQGLTEFLPVSSSGHLVLGGYALGLSEPHLLFDVVVHVATLVATLLVYRRSLVDMMVQLPPAAKVLVRRGGWQSVREGYPEAWLAVLIVVGTVPTGIIGVVFKEQLEALFSAPVVVVYALLATAVLLLSTRWSQRGERGLSSLGLGTAIAVGLVQGLAIIPGVSRSGATIATALLLGTRRELAARFSFLLSVPAIFGALLIQASDVGALQDVAWMPLVAGFLTALAVGVGALAFLIPVVRRGRFYLFAFYLVPLSLAGLWWLN